jgi:hypothetical protein
MSELLYLKNVELENCVCACACVRVAVMVMGILTVTASKYFSVSMMEKTT